VSCRLASRLTPFAGRPRDAHREHRAHLLSHPEWTNQSHKPRRIAAMQFRQEVKGRRFLIAAPHRGNRSAGASSNSSATAASLLSPMPRLRQGRRLAYPVRITGGTARRDGRRDQPAAGRHRRLLPRDGLALRRRVAPTQRPVDLGSGRRPCPGLDTRPKSTLRNARKNRGNSARLSSDPEPGQNRIALPPTTLYFRNSAGNGSLGGRSR
jgi:hypothetical protein